jgi:hypothetical protein
VAVAVQALALELVTFLVAVEAAVVWRTETTIL